MLAIPKAIFQTLSVDGRLGFLEIVTNVIGGGAKRVTFWAPFLLYKLFRIILKQNLLRLHRHQKHLELCVTMRLSKSVSPRGALYGALEGVCGDSWAVLASVSPGSAF